MANNEFVKIDGPSILRWWSQRKLLLNAQYLSLSTYVDFGLIISALVDLS